MLSIQGIERLINKAEAFGLAAVFTEDSYLINSAYMLRNKLNLPYHLFNNANSELFLSDCDWVLINISSESINQSYLLVSCNKIDTSDNIAKIKGSSMRKALYVADCMEINSYIKVMFNDSISVRVTTR